MLARIEIDMLLALCNWVVQDKRSVNLANLPAPDIIAAEIVEDLEAALVQFAEIAVDLDGRRETGGIVERLKVDLDER
jgi:ABC-type taurine transport system substrate-binding protein